MRDLFTLLLILFLTIAAPGQEVRPVRDSVGFCWNPVQMERLVSYLARHDSSRAEIGAPFVAISPHDDYLYAGDTYYPLFASLQTKEAVIIGVTHGTVRKEIGDPKGVIILDSFPAWRGLNGFVRPSPLREFIAGRMPAGMVLRDNRAHALEHSIEALIPFLLYGNPDVRITPVMVTAMPFVRMQSIADTLASLIDAYLRERKLVPGKDLVILISSDANHYGLDFSNAPFGEDQEAHSRGTALDQEIVRDCLEGELTEGRIERLTRRLWGELTPPSPSPLWCGKYSVPFGLLTARRVVQKRDGANLTGRLLRYSDTYTGGVLPLTQTGMGLTAPFSLKHWVGFFSMEYSIAK